MVFISVNFKSGGKADVLGQSQEVTGTRSEGLDLVQRFGKVKK